MARFQARLQNSIRVHTSMYSECLSRPVVLRVLCYCMCLFCTAHFVIVPDNCPDLSTLFITFFFEHLFSLYYVLCPTQSHRRQTRAGRAELPDTMLVPAAKDN